MITMRQEAPREEKTAPGIYAGKETRIREATVHVCIRTHPVVQKLLEKGDRRTIIS